MKNISLILVITAVLITACNNNNDSDAYGNFSATEILVSSETNGKILEKFVREGETIDSGTIVFVVDTVQSYLKKRELLARKKAVIAKKSNVAAQIEVLKEQKQALKEDIQRIEKMLAEGAASKKQLDDLNNNLRILDRQIAQVETNYASIDAEILALEVGVDQVADAINRAIVHSPVEGTVLNTFAETGETVAAGKPLLKIADLQVMELKAYFSGDQLPLIKLGDEVNVFADDGSGGLRQYAGIISMISSNAEFTPKIIQTKEERVNLVYAVKILVENDGSLKINMPGEVKLAEK